MKRWLSDFLGNLWAAGMLSLLVSLVVIVPTNAILSLDGKETQRKINQLRNELADIAKENPRTDVEELRQRADALSVSHEIEALSSSLDAKLATDAERTQTRRVVYVATGVFGSLATLVLAILFQRSAAIREREKRKEMKERLAMHKQQLIEAGHPAFNPRSRNPEPESADSRTGSSVVRR